MTKCSLEAKQAACMIAGAFTFLGAALGCLPLCRKINALYKSKAALDAASAQAKALTGRIHMLAACTAPLIVGGIIGSFGLFILGIVEVKPKASLPRLSQISINSAT